MRALGLNSYYGLNDEERQNISKLVTDKVLSYLNEGWSLSLSYGRSSKDLNISVEVLRYVFSRAIDTKKYQQFTRRKYNFF